MSKDKNKMTLAEQLCYITTLVETQETDGKKYMATGFFIEFYTDKKDPQVFLVTNRHVVENAQKMNIRLNYADEQGNPIDTQWVNIGIDNAKEQFIYHPDKNVDLALCTMAYVINVVKSKQNIFFRSLPPDFIVTDEWAENLDAIEDIIMVGYPKGIFDTTNNRPIVRKGITASDPKIDYEGKRLFMADIACFEGSSGSPVLAYKKRMREVTPQHTRWFDVSKLIGIQCAMPLSIESSSTHDFVRYRMPLNLGCIIKAQCLYDFIPMIEKDYGIKIDASFTSVYT